MTYWIGLGRRMGVEVKDGIKYFSWASLLNEPFSRVVWCVCACVCAQIDKTEYSAQFKYP